MQNVIASFREVGVYPTNRDRAISKFFADTQSPQEHPSTTIPYVPFCTPRSQPVEVVPKTPQCTPLHSQQGRITPNENDTSVLVQPDLKSFWEACGLLTVFNGLLLHGNRIVTPKKLQMETLSKLYHGHQGIQRCCLQASTSVWWPGISNDVEKLVRQCPQCCKSLAGTRDLQHDMHHKGSLFTPCMVLLSKFKIFVALEAAS